ncbi:MAG TPA: GDSL-type esterase/lipase family protein [Dehalococcoidia bacterium]|nr:GDSL-type esterase/lipase family protein [Dehalococcoidia bacterium]
MRWPAALLALCLFAAACAGGGGPDRLYIALGDSLSEGSGASDPATTAFVPLVHQGLGEGYQLLNLGHSGDTSRQLIDHGHLDEALARLRGRPAGGGKTDVRLITLEIGGNDLLNLYFDVVLSGTCPTVTESLRKDRECVQPLRRALSDFDANLGEILDRLQGAAPGVPLVLMTLYNPFSGGVQAFDELGQLSLEGLPDTPFPEGLNDIIRAQAQGRDVILVDIYPLFQGKAGEYVSSDFIHPNDSGYRVMADAVLQGIARACPDGLAAC